LSVYGAGFVTGRFLDGGGGSASAKQPDLTAMLPPEGVTIPVRWGDTLPRLVQQGVIDVEKFKAAAARSGAPLTPEQLRLLTEPSDENLRIDSSNAYFMVTVLWGLGIANKNSILEQGPMAKAGWDKRGNYAATGGWTLGDREGGEMVSAYELISLTPQQQATVEEVAFNSYRPCCGNATAFPDCNHGRLPWVWRSSWPPRAPPRMRSFRPSRLSTPSGSPSSTPSWPPTSPARDSRGTRSTPASW